MSQFDAATQNMPMSLEEMKKIFTVKLEKTSESHPAFEQTKKFLEKVKATDTLEWWGSDTYCTPVRVAYKNGHWFYSVYKWNGYHMAYTPWQDHEPMEIKDGHMVKWGWNELNGPTINNRIRLPIQGA